MISNFIKEIDELYGTFIDSTIGYELLKLKFEQLNPNLENSLHIGKGNPNLPETLAQHSVKFGVFFKRNSKGGDNFRIIANMTLVSIYQLWEDNYRGLISSKLGFGSKNELKLDAFGDLRIIRQAIIHNNGKSTSEFKKLKILKFVPSGLICISPDEVEIIINALKIDLRKINGSLGIEMTNTKDSGIG